MGYLDLDYSLARFLFLDLELGLELGVDLDYSSARFLVLDLELGVGFDYYLVLFLDLDYNLVRFPY